MCLPACEDVKSHGLNTAKLILVLIPLQIYPVDVVLIL